MTFGIKEKMKEKENLSLSLFWPEKAQLLPLSPSPRPSFPLLHVCSTSPPTRCPPSWAESPRGPQTHRPDGQPARALPFIPFLLSH